MVFGLDIFLFCPFFLLEYMKFLFTVLLSLLFFGNVFSQQLPSNGFYHIQNFGTERYIYVNDNTGSIQYAAATADMGAIWTWSNLERTISDPASVIYVENHGGNSYDLKSQGTGVHDIIGYYVDVAMSDGHYLVYASSNGVTLYLDDERTSKTKESGYLGTTKKGNYRLWDVFQLDNNTQHYFGLTPSVHVGDKHYAPFYASFAFSFASAGMKAYYVEKIDLGHVILKEWSEEKIPANMPVIIECSSLNPSDNKLNLFVNGGSNPSDNLLHGVYFANPYRPKSADAKTVFDPSIHRVLASDSDGNLCYTNVQNQNGSNPVFLQNTDPGSEWEGYCLAANQSFLIVDPSTPSELPVWTSEEYEAALEAKNKLYALTYFVDGEIFFTDSLHAGDSILLQVDPSLEGHTFSGWSGFPEDLIMPEHDVVISGSFAVNIYSVSVSCSDGGSVSVSSETIEYDGSLTITIIPDDNFEIVSVLINDTDCDFQPEGCTIVLENVLSDISIDVLFAEVTALDGKHHNDPVSLSAFDITGKHIVSGLSYWNNLPAGLYIVNGRKVVKK